MRKAMYFDRSYKWTHFRDSHRVWVMREVPWDRSDICQDMNLGSYWPATKGGTAAQCWDYQKSAENLEKRHPRAMARMVVLFCCIHRETTYRAWGSATGGVPISRVMRLQELVSEPGRYFRACLKVHLAELASVVGGLDQGSLRRDRSPIIAQVGKGSYKKRLGTQAMRATHRPLRYTYRTLFSRYLSIPPPKISSRSRGQFH